MNFHPTLRDEAAKDGAPRRFVVRASYNPTSQSAAAEKSAIARLLVADGVEALLDG
jgi:hypothetical protein